MAKVYLQYTWERLLRLLPFAGSDPRRSSAGDENAVDGLDPRLSWEHEAEKLSPHDHAVVKKARVSPETIEIAYFAVSKMLNLQKEVKRGDVVIYFGRDLYPVQEFLNVWETILKGTHLYVEGFSTTLVSQPGEESLNWLVKRINPHLPAKNVFLVDTGWGGSIPRAVAGKLGLGQERGEAQIRLFSSDYSQYDILGSGNPQRERAVAWALEELPKPFMRVVGEEAGEPLLHLPRRRDILSSIGVMQAVREASRAARYNFIKERRYK